MADYSEFHDGRFDGLLIEGTLSYIFVSTHKSERHVFIARGVFALLANEISAGNIILDLSVRAAVEVTSEEIIARSQTHIPYSSSGIDCKVLEMAQTRSLIALVIDPSYGASCLVFANSFQRVSYSEWVSLQGS